MRAAPAVALAAVIAALAACSPPAEGGNGAKADAGGDTTTPLSGLTIASVTPNRGPVAGGDEVDIAGDAIGPATRVFFGAVEAEVVWRAGSTHLFARVPPAVVPGAVDVRLVDVDGDVRLRSGYAYLGEVRIDEVTPLQGPAQGGTPILVEGAGFHPGDRLLVGWRAAQDSAVADGGTLVARTPAFPLPAGKDFADVPVAVRHASGVTTFVGTFRYGRPPRLQRVEPAVLAAEGGAVTLLGEGLGGIDALYVDARAATLAPGDADSLRGAALPSAASLGLKASQAVAIAVSGPFGDDVLDPALAYDLGGAPALFGVVPKVGGVSGGDSVALLAALGGGKASGVRFGGKDAKIVVAAKAPLVETPALAVGVHDVALDVGASKLSAKAAFTAFAVPSFAKLSPDAGPLQGGNEIELHGAGLVAGCQVRIGAWPAVVLSANAATLRLRMPPGPAGPAPLSLRCGPHHVAVADAYRYLPGKPQLDAAVPASGATGGGAQITLYGAGFGPACTVALGGKTAQVLEVIAGGRLRVKTPPHKPGPVTVDVVCPDGADALVDGFTYYSPTNPQGGTYGGPTLGTLNVTVLDIYTLKPLPGATVVLGQASDAIAGKYKAVTDAKGQVVFVGDDLVPPLTVSATKVEYSASSIVHFGVTNATLLLFPYVPPSSGGGGGGPGLPLATLKGRILDLDKYVLMPPTSCLKPPTGGPICDFCEADADCQGAAGTWACVTTGAAGKRCFPECQSDDDCDTDYRCGVDVLVPERKVCRPSIGIRKIVCQTSTRQLESDNPPPGPGSVVHELTGDWSISARLDELAVYCVAGYVKADNTLVPTSMGVRRHIFPEPGQTLAGLDLRLDIPLQRTVELRLDQPQRFFPANNGGTLRVGAWIDLGSDGFIPIAEVVSAPAAAGKTGVLDVLKVPYQPLLLPEAMTDTSQTWRAVVDFGSAVAPRETGTQHESIVRPGDANQLRRGDDGVWEAEPLGVAMPLAGIVRGPANELLMVSRLGRVLRGPLAGPGLLHVPVVSDLYEQLPVVLAVAGTPTDATMVGQAGLVRRLLGDSVGSEKGALVEDLRGVCHGNIGRVVVGAGGGVAVDRGHGWVAIGNAGKPLHAVACVGDGALAVGDAGVLVRVVAKAAEGATPASATMTTTTEPSAGALHAALARADGTVLVAGDSADGAFGVLLRVAANGERSDAWPVGSKPRPKLRLLVDGGDATVFGADGDGHLARIDALGVFDESPQRLDVVPRAGVRLDDGRLVLVGDPGLWLGPFLTVPAIGKPLDAGNPKPLEVAWAVAPGPAPTIQRVHLDGQGFPFWWLYVAKQTTTVTLPDFVALAGISVLMDVPYVARVDRIWTPTQTIDGFSTFDVEFGPWRSWSTNGKAFSL